MTATVIGIIGPTGVGKTAVAMELAVRLGVRVISCDSMQVYRGFPVLTNQPTDAQMRAVPHELVGIIDPACSFSVGEYAQLARPMVEDDVAGDGWALVCGGTGLYLRAALAPLALAPAVDPGARRALEQRLAEEGADALHAELGRRDPRAAAAISPHNSRRLIRALEVIEATGAPWSGRQDLWSPAYYHPTLLVALTLDRDGLYARIDARAADIVRGGGADEVRRHLARLAAAGVESPAVALRAVESPAEESPAAALPGVEPVGDALSTVPLPPAAPVSTGVECAIGYREISRYLEGRQSLDETISQVAAATRRYARRQSTWLRKLEDAVIINDRDRDPEAVADEILALALSGQHTRGPHQS